MANKKRRCRNCKKYELAEVGKVINNGFYCSEKCMLDYAMAQGKARHAKKERKEVKDAKEKIKTRAEHLKEAQSAFNAFIRERDKGKPCISCNRHHSGQYHAGHYLSVGSHPEMRFDELNCYKQCAPCNNHLSGNIVEYRKSLLSQYGSDLLEYLEGYHEPKKYTIEQIKEIKVKYKNKLKELRNNK